MTAATATSTLKGTLVRVTADRGGWFAGYVEADGERHSVAGTCSAVPPIGSTVELSGRVKTHPHFGDQFAFASCSHTLPSTRSGAIRYLMGLPGIGPKKAEAIVDALGPDAPRRIAEAPECLAEVGGLGKAASTAGEAVADMMASLAVDISLSNMGFGSAMQRRIKEHFGDRLQSTIERNPYALTDVERVSFRMVDNAVMALGTHPPEHPQRVSAAIAEALKEASTAGHTWLPTTDLLEFLGRLQLSHAVPVDAVEIGITGGVTDGRLVRVEPEGGIALRILADAEAEIAGAICSMLTRDDI